MSETRPDERGAAQFGERRATWAVECIDISTDAHRLAEGLWFVVVEFEGRARAWRFADDAPVTHSSESANQLRNWSGPDGSAWRSSMSRSQYQAAVTAVREHIREGEVYQANICRVLSAPLTGAPLTGTASDGQLGQAGSRREPDAHGLAEILAVGNPAPYGGFVHVPASCGLEPVWVVSASPELYLSVQGNRITSAPIKGTAQREEQLLEKDRAENVMITDLVRNDLQRISVPGSIEVAGLLDVEHHPGLVHLVTTVHATLKPEVMDSSNKWLDILNLTFPPGSVSGAPKESALGIISDLETVPRGPYCGAIGWIDGSSGDAQLAVGIRTFWWEGEHGVGSLKFGTGAGITWGSDPAAEWAETELKANRLIALASRSE